MGELLAGLYDDLLELDDVAEKPSAPDPAVSAVQESDKEKPNVQQEPSSLDTRTPVKRQQPVKPAAIPHPQLLKPVVEQNMTSTKKLKYFIMKSNNSTNIDRSLASGVWSTQRHNEAKLNKAFVEGFEVRLIFSINQSGHFQGYAIMKSAIGRGPKHNIWIGTAWGGFFEIDWQVQHDFPFSRFEHLSNPLNEGKPVKFARDGQEVPTDVGNEVVRIMQDIARASGLSKPVIANQLKVDPYPIHSFADDRQTPIDRRDYDLPRERGMGMGRGRGRTYRWGEEAYARYHSGYPPYGYAPTASYPYHSRWNDQSAYSHPYSVEYSRQGYAAWGPPSGEADGYGPLMPQKRRRSPTSSQLPANKKSLYEMTYEEYLECYDRVQKRLHEVIHSGELWKALGMIPEEYAWTEEDQRRVMESGWFDAWFGGLVGNGGAYISIPKQSTADVESASGSRDMSESEFIEFCRKFCGDRMQFDEEKVKAYFERMEAMRELTATTSKRARTS